MSLVNEYKNKVMSNVLLNREELIELEEEPLDELIVAADEIRLKFCGNKFDLCTIINGKCGKCSENCKFCAQSAFYKTNCQENVYRIKK